MAERFNLTAQIQLQAPTNTAQVVNKMKKDLGSVGVNVKIQGDSKSLSAVQGQLKNVDKSARSSAKGMNLLNRNIAEAARRFSVITIATGSMIALTRAIKNSVGAAISFERELVKIAQVTGNSVQQLSGLSNEVTRLSTTLGVANQSLLETARILAQAGYSALKTRQALEILANTTLAPSFDNIIDTTEGAIAVVNQFGREAKRTGDDIKFLEASLDAINQVSKTFAVESKDLITAIRRTGGVFEAAGGKLNELIALFTSVRQTTRESAETIATGFRTIFTRLQRSETLEALEQLGINLSDLEGKFIGPMQAIKALADGLAGLDPRDVRFNEIVEQLGGFRQIGKVIPLIKQYAVAENALSVANSSLGSTSKDAQTAQQALAVQFMKVREQFDALMRKFVDSGTFKSLAGTVLQLAESFIKFAGALGEVLPMLVSLAAIKIGRALAPGVAGLMGGGGRGRHFGGKITGYAGGGWVPGEGDRDTVPAMLTPGEFVIKKSSAKKLGSQRLAAMNAKRFEKGGDVEAEKVGRVVPAGGGTQGSHIGADLGLTDEMVKVAMNAATIKFKRSFVSNAVFGGHANMDEDQKEILQSDTEVKKIFAENLAKNSARMVSQVKQNMGLTAKTPIKLNYPSSWNQALRSGDPDLVDKNEMARYSATATNLFGSLPAAIQKSTAFKAQLQPIQAGIAGHIGSIRGSALEGTAFDDDRELESLKGYLVTQLRSVAPKATAALLSKADFMFSGSGWTTSKGDKRTSQDRDENRDISTALALGGLVQRFAMGGLATQKSVGAAILDPHSDQPDDKVKVTVAELNQKFPKFKNLKKGASPISSLYKATDFSIVRQGLSQSTSAKFQTALNEGLVAGTDEATAMLARDLGTSAQKIDGSTKQNFIATVRPAIRGDLFEAALLSMNNEGLFDAKLDPNRPFDFPMGLQGGLKDNFSALPANWIDAKSSYAAAATSNMKGKIVKQLVNDLKMAGVEGMDVGAGGSKAAKSADGTTTAAKGGSIQGSDSVPALLTPGEFVINKSAAQSIGLSNLSRMNQTGISRFDVGGPVGFQRFAAGGGVGGPGQMADLSSFAAEAPRAAEMIAKFTQSVAQAHTAMTYYKQGIDQGLTENEALNKASQNLNDAMYQLDSGYQEAVDQNKVLTQEQEQLSGNAKGLSKELANEAAVAKQKAAIDAKYLALRKQGISAVEARRQAIEQQIKEDGMILVAKQKLKAALGKQAASAAAAAAGGGGAAPGGGGGGVMGIKDAVKGSLNMKGVQKGLDRFAKGMTKMQSILSRVSSGLIGLSFIAGMVVQGMSGLSSEQKEQEQAAIAGTAAYAAIGAEIASFGIQLIVATARMIAATVAKGTEIAASFTSAGADTAEAVATTAATTTDAAEAGMNVMATASESAEVQANLAAAAAEGAELAASIGSTIAMIALGVAAIIAGVGVLALGVVSVVAGVGVLALGVVSVVAGVGVLALGVVALVATVGILAIGVAAILATVGMVVMAVAATIAAVAMVALAVGAVLSAVALVALAVISVVTAVVLVVLAASAAIAAAMLLIVAASAALAAVALAVAAVAAVIAALAITVLAVASIVAALAMTVQAVAAAISAIAMTILAVAAIVASVGMILLAATSVVAAIGTGLLAVTSVVAAIGVGVLGIASIVATVAIGLLAAASIVAGVGVAILGVVSMFASIGVGLLGVVSLAATLGVGLLAAASIIGTVGLLALGAASFIAAAGILLVTGAFLLIVGVSALAGFGIISMAGGSALAGIALIGLGVVSAIAAVGVAALGVVSLVAAVGVAALGVVSLVAAVGVAALGVVSLVATVGVLALGIASAIAAVGVLVLGVVSVIAAVGVLALGIASLLATVGVLALGIASIISAVGVLVLGVASVLAAVGVLVLGVASVLSAVGVLALGIASALSAVAVLALGIASLVTTVAVLALGIASVLTTIAVLALGIASIIAAVAVAVLAVASIVAAVGVLVLGVASIIAAVGVIALGIASIIAAVGVLVLGVASVLAAVAMIVFTVVTLAAAIAMALLAITTTITAVAMTILMVATIVTAAGMLILAVVTLLEVVAMTLLTATTIITAVGMTLLAIVTPITAVAMTVLAAASLITALSMTLLAVTTPIAAVAMTILAAGALLAAPGVLLLGVASVFATVSTTALAVSAIIATVALIALAAAIGVGLIGGFVMLGVGILGLLVGMGALTVGSGIAAGANVVQAGSSGAVVVGNTAHAGSSGLVVAGNTAQAASSGAVVVGNTAQAGSSGLVVVGNTAQATSSAGVTVANVLQSISSAAASMADAAKAISAFLASGGDIAKSISAFLASAGDMVKTVMAGLAAVMDGIKALAGAIVAFVDTLKSGAGLAAAASAFLAALGLTGVAISTAPVTAGMAALAMATLAVTWPFLALAAIVMVVVAALALFAVGYAVGWIKSVYQTIKATTALKQSMEALNKVADKSIEGLRESGAGNEEEFVQARSGAAISEFNKQLLDSTKFSRAHAEGMRTGAKMVVGAGGGIAAALGLVALSSIPVVGWLGALVGVAGGLTGSLVGLAASSDNTKNSMQELITSEEARAAKIAAISTLYATTTWRAVKSLIEFERSLKDAKEANLSAAETLDIMNAGMAGLMGTFEGGEQKLKESTSKRSDLQAELEGMGLVSERGTIIGEGSDQGEIAALAEYEEIVKQENEARKAHNDLLKKILQQESQIRRKMQDTFGELIKDLSGGTGGKLTEVTSFDDLLNVGETRRIYEESIKNINKLIELEFKAAIEEAEKAGDVDLVAGLKAKKAVRLEGADLQIKEAALSRLLAEQKASRAILQTEMIERAKQRAIDDVNTTLKGFNNALLGATATANAMAAIDPAIAIANFEGPEAATFDTAALELPLNQIDPDILNDAMDQGVAGMKLGRGTNAPAGDPIDQEIANRADDIKKKVNTIQDIIEAIPASKMASTFEIPTDSPEQKKLEKKLFKNLDEMVGGALSGDPDLTSIVKLRLSKMMDEGKPITTEVLQDLVGDLEEVAEADLEALKRSIEVQNKFLQDMDKVNSAIIAQEGKLADALAKVTEVAARGADRMLKAKEGGRVSTSADIRGQRFGRETGRRVAAGQRLGGVARGAGAIGGDVRATAAALKTLQAEANASAEAAKKATDPAAVQGFNDAAKRAADGAKRAAGELERLANQSARAADLEKELNQIRKGRKQIGAEVEKFAFGSDEGRRDQMQQYEDLKLAIGQGGIQGATEDERSNVSSVLDALADVENVGGTGKTGRQLKAEFAEKEAIAQGMDPAIAKQIGQAAAAGPREEALLGELAAIGAEELAAAQAMAANTKTQIEVLEEIRDQLEENFERDINQGQRDASIANAAKKRADADAKLAEALDDANVAVNKAEESWKDANDALKLFQTALTNATKALEKLQDPKVQKDRRDEIGKNFKESKSGKALLEVVSAIQGMKDAEKTTESGEEQQVAALTAAGQWDDERKVWQGGISEAEAREKVEGDRYKVEDDEKGNKYLTGRKEIEDMDPGEIESGVLQMIDATFKLAVSKIDTGDIFGDIAAKTKLTEARDQALGMIVRDIGNMEDKDVQLSQQMDTVGKHMASVFAPMFKELMRAQAGPGSGGLARGGLVYLADGGSIFKPKGTDTVPAMLTPGEYVIRKSAVDKIGVSNLDALNMRDGGAIYRQGGGGTGGVSSSGAVLKGMLQILRLIYGEQKKGSTASASLVSSGGMIYRAGGGSIFKPKGTDTVPAMLTPGEFVIRKSAVDKIGAGNLAAMNRGTGGVVYRAGGGPIGIPAAGVASNAFFGILSAGKAGPIIKALKSAYGGNAKQMYEDLKRLAKKGKLDVRKIEGPETVEAILDVLRQSSGLESFKPIKVKSPVLQEGKWGDFTGKFPPSTEDRAIMGAAVSQMGSFGKSLASDIEKIKELEDRVTGGGTAAKGVEFVSQLLIEGGVLKKSLAEQMKAVRTQMALNEIDIRDRHETWEALWTQSSDFDYDDGTMDPDLLVDGKTGGIIKYWIAPGQRPHPAGVMNTKYVASNKSYDALIETTSEYRKKAADKAKEEAEVRAVEEGKKAKAGMGVAEGLGYDRLIEAGVLRMATGGSVSSGLDKIPAMLTPGEFVMSPEAVRKHGVGFMRNLNRGSVPGFRKGGLIGSGNVAYRRGGSKGAEGGGGMTLMLDPTNIQGVLDNFNATFAATLDNVIVQFSQIGEGLNNLAGVLSSGMVMTHQFTGDLALAFKIENADQLKKTIADAITPRLSEIITMEIDKRLNKDFKAGS